tara:strand:+ start:1981 stop:2607 length:627 start_codon:yes stop_codon:yes gene_type:complete
MSEYGYIPEAPEQSFGNNKGIFNPKDIYDLTRADKYTNYGQLELIETKTASGDNIVDFTDIKEDIYNVHFATISASINNTGSVNVRFFESGVLETASVYQSAYQGGTATGSFDESKSTTRSRLFATKVGASGDTRSAYNYFYNLGDSTKYSFQTMQGVSRNTGTTACDMRFGSGVLPQASQVDGIRFTETSGGLLTGTISLYGIKEYS